MYFPDDPLFFQDPMYNSVADRDRKAAERMISAFDYDSTEEQWALAFRWDIVLRGEDGHADRGAARMTTPSQTVGPYLSIGLPWPDGPDVVPEGTPGRIRLYGKVFDGDGAVIPDALIETWQADADGKFGTDFRGFGRAPTNDDGEWEIFTVKPGRARRRPGAAHRRQRLRPRHAQPLRHADLLRRLGQQRRPGARHGARGAPRHADRDGRPRTATASTSTCRARVRPSSSSV